MNMKMILIELIIYVDANLRMILCGKVPNILIFNVFFPQQVLPVDVTGEWININIKHPKYVVSYVIEVK